MRLSSSPACPLLAAPGLAVTGRRYSSTGSGSSCIINNYSSSSNSSEVQVVLV